MKISTIICRNAARINFSNSLRTHVFVILLFTFIITPGIVAQKFIDIKNFDLSVKPTDDFYEYANGGWMKNTPIPPDQSRWSSGGEIQERNYALLKNILESAAMNTSASKGSIVQKVGDFYYTGMDTNTIESQGATPLEEEFKTIQAITTTGQLIDEISNFHLTGAGLPFEFDARQDFKNSSQVIAQLYQGGLGLPDRDYYIKEDAQTKDIREKYAKHIANMFKLRGENEETASVDAKTVVDFETRLAKASMTQVEQRNLEAVYNILTLDELQKSTPNIPWGKFFSNIGLSHPGKLNVGQPKFLQEVNAMVNDVPLNDWKTYLRWHLINETAEYLSSAFVNEHFDFFGKTLTGQKS